MANTQALRFFFVELLLGTEEVSLHLKGAQALTIEMVMATILERWPSAIINNVEEAEKPFDFRNEYLEFDQDELVEEQPEDWLYARESTIDEDGEEYLSGRQFRLSNKVFFELQARKRYLAREEAKSRETRKRLSKEVILFLKENKISIDEYLANQKAH